MSLIDDARAVRLNAYAPYSNFQVGAAIRTTTGAVFQGCNVENVAYPEGTCAEAGAIAAMVAAGETQIAEIAVIANSPDPVSPCGGCRQKIAEFAQAETKVLLATTDGVTLETTVSKLLPGAFDAGAETFRSNIVLYPSCQGCVDGGPDPDLFYQVERSYIDNADSLLFTKFSPDGQTQLYATYLGVPQGGLNASINSMGVSGTGEVGFGVSGVEGLPLVNETQTFLTGSVYVAKLNAAGNGLVFATYLNIGNGWVRGLDVATDGSLALTGYLSKETQGFPEVNPLPGQSCAFTAYPDFYDIYVAKFNSVGLLDFSSCFGGTGINPFS